MQKKKKWGKKMSGNFAIKGGGGAPLMANANLNFHFDFLNPSLTEKNGFNASWWRCDKFIKDTDGLRRN